MTPAEAKKRIVVALDMNQIEDVMQAVAMLAPHGVTFKVGLEALSALGGLSLVHEIHAAGGSVFYDGKFKDIPNTVAGAVRAVTRRAVRYMNMHVCSGVAAMKAAVAARDEEWERHPQKDVLPKPMILGVTVLTSLGYDDLVHTGEIEDAGVDQGGIGKFAGPPEGVTAAKLDAVCRKVVRRAKLAQACGLDGVVCSPLECAPVGKACGKGFFRMIPGVRPTWAAANDQERIMTEEDAMAAGADAIVVGRPILKPPHGLSTLEALERFAYGMSKAKEAA